MNKLIAFGLASIFSFLLFVVMTVLIDTEAKAIPNNQEPVVMVDFKPSDLNPTTKPHEIKKPEPPEVKPMPTPPQANTEQAQPRNVLPPIPRIALGDTSQLSTGLGVGINRFSGNGSRDTGDTGLIPQIRIEPQYPPKAAEKAIEGFVTLQFDIDVSGSPTNIIVLDSKPKGYFENASRKAVRKWKFNPSRAEGQSGSVARQTVTLDFKLEKEN